MRIEHIALWTEDIERLKDFYVRYFAEPVTDIMSVIEDPEGNLIEIVSENS